MMRRTTHDAAVIMDEETFVGFNLGWDYTAEHEWGITTIWNLLGMPGGLQEDGPLGLGRFTMTSFDPDFFYKTGNQILFGPWVFARKGIQPDAVPDIAATSTLKRFGKEAFSGAWSDSSFGIQANNPVHLGYLKELWEAFQAKDVAIWLGGSLNPFSRSGLVICIASRIPLEQQKSMEASDTDTLALQAADMATGIRDKLAAAGKRVLALSPRWAKDLEKETSHPVVYWLNPWDQKIFQPGWYSTEELEKWINNEGPVLKEPVS